MTEPWTSEHIKKWLIDAGERLNTKDGKEVRVLEFRHQPDKAVLSAWAKHFRNHYCLDTQIDILRGRSTRSVYLANIKFPDKTSRLGPSVRAGDFGEILVADYLQWILGCWVPRVRWSSKVIRDESPRGCDVIGFYLNNKNGAISGDDTLFIFESKTQFSNRPGNRLQQAINDSAKDQHRLAESLNFIRQKFAEKYDFKQVKIVDRFQNLVDSPYIKTYGAVAIISDIYFDSDVLATSDCNKSIHPNRDNLILIVIKGDNMMDLVHELYTRAANEA